MIKKVVLDTNTIISALMFGGKPRMVLMAVVEGRLEGFISRFIISEVMVVLRQKFDYEQFRLEEVEKMLLSSFKLVDPVDKFNQIKECVADNRIVECAMEAEADYLVSGDKKHLLPLGQVGEVKIVDSNNLIELVFD